DSVRMHAIDNLYFGKNPGTTSRKFLVDDMEYNVKKSMGNPVYYYMLENSSRITTKKKADRVLTELKDIIANKYNNGLFLNRTYYTKHPEENEKIEVHLNKELWVNSIKILLVNRMSLLDINGILNIKPFK
uniref:hypothetical protein n=1 Tax=Flavobacterium filum TaxID=370974 RepID=UPI0023F091D9